MTLSTRLKVLRQAAGLSQSKLADLAGVTRNAVSQWEAGRTLPSTKRLVLIARALAVPMDQLMAPSNEVRNRVVDAATRLFDRVGIEETSDDVLCAAADIDKSTLTSLFSDREALLSAVLADYTERSLAEIRRMPPKYGSLSARQKYLLRMLSVHDLAHLRLATALHARSWQWSEARERDHARQLSEFHDTIIALFDDAVATRQIKPGHFRAASNLIYAAYVAGLRRALFERTDSDRLVAQIEPQLAIILTGFGFADAYGFAEDDTAT